MIENFSLQKEKGCALGLFLMVVIYIFTAFFGQTILTSLGYQTTSATYIAINACFSCFSIVVVLFIYVKKHKVSYKEIITCKEFNSTYLLFGVLLAVGMFFGLGFINALISNLFNSLNLNVSSIDIPLDSPLKLVVFSVVFAIFPAIFEELFFRWYLLKETKGLGQALSLIIVSVAFALYHFSLAQLVYQLIYGGFLFYLTKKSKSVFPAMLAHFLNNFSILLLEYFSLEIDLFNPLIIIFGLACLISFVLLTFKSGEAELCKVKSKISEFLLPYGVATILICLFIAVMGVI